MTLKLLITKILKVGIALLLAFFILSMLITTYFLSKGKSISGFCDSIKMTDQLTDVVVKAKQQGLVLFNENTKIKTGTLYIYNKKSPFGRLACVITLENGNIIKTEQITAD